MSLSFIKLKCNRGPCPKLSLGDSSSSESFEFFADCWKCLHPSCSHCQAESSISPRVVLTTRPLESLPRLFLDGSVSGSVPLMEVHSFRISVSVTVTVSVTASLSLSTIIICLADHPSSSVSPAAQKQLPPWWVNCNNPTTNHMSQACLYTYLHNQCILRSTNVLG
jgi:hypothetical protein